MKRRRHRKNKNTGWWDEYFWKCLILYNFYKT
jgi:hypothetical protein